MLVSFRKSSWLFCSLMALVGLAGCGLLSNDVTIAEGFDRENCQAIAIEVKDLSGRHYHALSPELCIETAASAVLLRKGYDHVELREQQKQLDALKEANSRRSATGGPRAGRSLDIQAALYVDLIEFKSITEKDGEESIHHTRIRLSARLVDVQSGEYLWEHVERAFEFDSPTHDPDANRLMDAAEMIIEQLPPRPFFWWFSS